MRGRWHNATAGNLETGELGIWIFCQMHSCQNLETIETFLDGACQMENAKMWQTTDKPVTVLKHPS